MSLSVSLICVLQLGVSSTFCEIGVMKVHRQGVTNRFNVLDDMSEYGYPWLHFKIDCQAHQCNNATATSTPTKEEYWTRKRSNMLQKVLTLPRNAQHRFPDDVLYPKHFSSVVWLRSPVDSEAKSLHVHCTSPKKQSHQLTCSSNGQKKKKNEQSATFMFRENSSDAVATSCSSRSNVWD